MSSPSSRAFCCWAGRQSSARTLEVGSRNINGSLRECMTIDVGIDMIDGKGVDEIMDAQAMTFEDAAFGVLVSDNAIEHTPDWRPYLSECWRVLETGGAFAITAASPKKGRHGYPNDYWRWRPEHWQKIFQDQDIDEVYMSPDSIWNGVRGRKVTDTLRLDVKILTMGRKRATELEE